MHVKLLFVNFQNYRLLHDVITERYPLKCCNHLEVATYEIPSVLVAPAMNVRAAQYVQDLLLYTNCETN